MYIRPLKSNGEQLFLFYNSDFGLETHTTSEVPELYEKVAYAAWMCESGGHSISVHESIRTESDLISYITMFSSNFICRINGDNVTWLDK